MIPSNQQTAKPSFPEKILTRSVHCVVKARFAVILTLLLGFSVGSWWAITRYRLLANPPLPLEINDEEIAEAINKARQEVIKNPTASNWGYLGMLLTAHQYDQNAAECYREAFRLDPQDSRWPFILGITAIKRDPNDGLDHIKKAIEVNTWDRYQVSMVMALVELLIERNQFEEAEKYLSTVVAEGFDQSRVNLARGWLAFQKGDEVAAREYFSTLQTNRFARRKVTAQLATLAHSANDSVEAVRLENELKKMPADPDWPDPLIYEIIKMRVGKRARENNIKTLEDQKKYAEAAQEFIDDLKKERTLKRLVGAGMNLTRSKQYPEALKYLYEAVSNDPESAQARHYLSICLLMDAAFKFANHGDPEEVEMEFLECVHQARVTIQLKPDHANGFLICGSALKMLGQYKASIEVLQQALTIKPDNFVMHMALAEAYKSKGDVELAKKHFDLAAKAEPTVASDPRLIEIIDSIKTPK